MKTCKLTQEQEIRQARWIIERESTNSFCSDTDCPPFDDGNFGCYFCVVYKYSEDKRGTCPISGKIDAANKALQKLREIKLKKLLK